MIGSAVPLSPNGVYVESGPSKVTFPLLLTQSWSYERPKKFSVKPIGTELDVESSSFGGIRCWVQSAALTIAPERSVACAAGEDQAAGLPDADSAADSRRAEQRLRARREVREVRRPADPGEHTPRLSS